MYDTEYAAMVRELRWLLLDNATPCRYILLQARPFVIRSIHGDRLNVAITVLFGSRPDRLFDWGTVSSDTVSESEHAYCNRSDPHIVR